MFTDIVGYNALMGKDSNKALELVRQDVDRFDEAVVAIEYKIVSRTQCVWNSEVTATREPG